jgi:anti-sigma regulatory factor (Ser/Thr protein kinase)
MPGQLDTQVILDGLGHGVLIFDAEGRLLQHNQMAATRLGNDLNLIRSEGWAMVVSLFDAGITDPDAQMATVRERALRSERPVRFRIYRAGAYIPCTAAAIGATDGSVYLMLTIDVPDWTLVGEVLDQFRTEMADAVDSTLGHISLIMRTVKQESEKTDSKEVQRLSKRISGFTRLIDIHMNRAGRLMNLLERLQDVRTGNIRDIIRRERKTLKLGDFFEDFLEEIEEVSFLDPETEVEDYRARIQLDQVSADLKVLATPRYLKTALQELLRNAIMYSLRGTGITLRVERRGHNAQVSVIDEGYGIRSKDHERVWIPFQRGHQPQIISEFGYGLALHLCKTEIESMNGSLWFESEEGVGTSMCMTLPLQPEQT